MAVSPFVAIVAARLAKWAFGREKDGALAYPSGHTTSTVVVLGLAVLVAGAATWAVVAAVTAAALGVLGQGLTYHYFTDAVGARLPRHRAGRASPRWSPPDLTGVNPGATWVTGDG